MTEEKRPDNVVFNIETASYDASLKPYATNVGAPVITPTDTITWKNRSISKINHKVATTYLELQNAYQKMMEEFAYNNLIFNSKFNFEPIVGETYHLYERKNGESFLSLIAPEECNFQPLGTFYLNADQIWEKIETKNVD